ncbi:MAG: DUF3488 and transglutaminase-like domain-containing protein [Nocardioides sp.]|nr:DUF3488 and transglutaminase-like domain-containing protein [Nocardioides sp.]
MSPSPSSTLVGVLSAFTAAATTWVAVLAWRGFTEDAYRFLVPLAVLGFVVAGLGSLLRWWRAPAAVVVLTQVVVSTLVAAAIISRHLLPLGEGWSALRLAFTDAQESANTFAPPVPADVPGVHPYLILGGLGCLVMIDVIACTLRRAPLAGLPLLAVYSVPVGMLGITLSWWVFALTAGGYLVLLYLEQGDRVRRWGHTLAGDTHLSTSRSRTPSGVRANAGAIGGGVTFLAVLLPLFIPTLSVQLFDLGNRVGGNGDVAVVNPTTDLRRDLRQAQDVPLVRVTTDDPDPSYLRIATLNRFSDNEWSSGDREIPANQRADGELPPLAGVDPDVPRVSYTHRLQATDGFASTWLPTPAQTTKIEARGDWRYDGATRDFIASSDDLTTKELQWDLTAVELTLDATTLARAPSSVGQVDVQFTELPRGIDPYVGNLAAEITRDAPSRFEKAVALQNWFRQSGGFTYDLSVNLGTGTDDLVRFLSPGDGGRTGYCEQFASAMAVMARQLGIPARVSVGFLRPEETSPGSFEFSSKDLHAWPELFISGAGWVRFEPTPATRANGVPGYTRQGVTPLDPNVPAASNVNPEVVPRNRPSAEPTAPAEAGDTATGAGQGRGPWMVLLLAALVLAMVVGLVALPGLVRRRRRGRRRAGGVEPAWAELEDTSTDLGLTWPEARSPRETGAALSRSMADPAAVAALERIVGRLERSRYARDTGSSDGLGADLDRCREALLAAAGPGARRRAALLPVSVLRRRSQRTALSGPRPDESSGERLLERV